MNSIIVSFRLRGGVKQLRTAENISEKECNAHIDAARKGSGIGAMVNLPSSVRNHMVENEELLCEKRVTLNEQIVANILSGGSRPSMTQCRAFNLGFYDGRKFVFNAKKWTALPAQQRLIIWLSDLAHDYQAVSYTWVELG